MTTSTRAAGSTRRCFLDDLIVPAGAGLDIRLVAVSWEFAADLPCASQ